MSPVKSIHSVFFAFVIATGVFWSVWMSGAVSNMGPVHVFFNIPIFLLTLMTIFLLPFFLTALYRINCSIQIRTGASQCRCFRCHFSL